MQPITFKKEAAQGDLLLTRIDGIPLTKAIAEPLTPRADGKIVISHKDSNHPHVLMNSEMVSVVPSTDEYILYATVTSDVVLSHEKTGPHAHLPLLLKPGVYEIRRQREQNHVTRSWQRAAD